MADAPPPQVKKWGKQEKQLQAKLIKKGKVDLSRENDVEYIDQVRFKYYRERDDRNFRRNFRNYVRECLSTAADAAVAFVTAVNEASSSAAAAATASEAPLERDKAEFGALGVAAFPQSGSGSAGGGGSRNGDDGAGRSS
jgi:hypothetical protein